MPGLDCREARARLQLAEMLDLLGFARSQRRGDQVRGPCPVHRSRTRASRAFAAHLQQSKKKKRKSSAWKVRPLTSETI
jgi:hypothetical protein